MIEFDQRLRPRGVLRLKAGEKRMRLTLTPPSEELKTIVEHYWMVEWELPEGESYRQYNIPHPCVHLVVEREMSGVFGVMSRLFSYLMSGKGRVFGIKFVPGGFRLLNGRPISALTDTRLAIGRVLGPTGERYEQAVLSCAGTAQELVQIAEEFLRACGAVVDETQLLIRRVVGLIVSDRDIVKVDDLVQRFGIGKRRLQRIFHDYVGVGPKWVINRYRLVEAADRLEAGEAVDLAALAQELGYFDQAHFIRDFKGLVGNSPAEYARSARGD